MFVSNTSTLILLAKISALRIFLDNAPTIIIPEEVKEEYQQKTLLDTKLIEYEISQQRIIVKKDENKTKDIVHQFNLDRGEAAAYCLFDKKKHLAILTDDGELIKLCKLTNTPFICALAIIARLYEKDALTKQETLEKMEKLTIVGRYSPAIYDHYRKEVEKHGNSLRKNEY